MECRLRFRKMPQMTISNLLRLLVLGGAGYRACLAGKQAQDHTLSVVSVNGLLMVGLLLCLLLILDSFKLFYLTHHLSCCLLSLAANENGTPRKQDSTAGGKKIQSNIRIIRGHAGAITALHCVTKREVWDLVGDREDAGFFISGSTDCLVSYISGCFLLTTF